MNNLRTFIDIIESFNDWKPQKQAFGRKGGSVLASPELPRDPKKLASLTRCRKYASAEKYVADNNPFYSLRAGDPQSLQDRADAKSEELEAEWLHWKRLGHY